MKKAFNIYDYDSIAHKRDVFINRIGKRITVKGVKGNAFFLQKAHELILQSDQILEIGTGTGTIPLWLGHLEHSMICIDSSPNMIAIARKNCVQYPHVQFQVADLHHLPFQNDFFDLVLKRLAPDNLQEISRVMRPEGSFLNLTNGERDGEELRRMFDIPLHESVAAYRKKIITHRFRIIGEKEFVFQETYHAFADIIRVLEIAPLIPDCLGYAQYEQFRLQ